MKLKMEESADLSEIEITVRYPIQACTITLQGEKDGGSYPLSIETILYIESVDDHTFLYCESSVYDSHQKLYELEECLKHTAFVRISKSCIANTDYLVHVKPLFDGNEA